MLGAIVVAVVFAGLFVVTWLSSRADAARTRCEAHLRHINRLLEIPSRPPAIRRPRRGPPVAR